MPLFHFFAIDLNAPTSLGVPLGVLLLFLFLMRAIRENTNAKAGSSYASSQTHYTSANTMTVRMRGELSDAYVSFRFSEAEFRGSQCYINYTIELHKDGPFVIVAGKVDNQKVDRGYYGLRNISGTAGEVLSGTITCRSFYSGTWGIGAYRDSKDIHFC